MQAIRKRAMKRKYLQYVIDPIYRQKYRNKIFYNVNLDVPNEVHVDHLSQVLIADRETADEMQLRRVPNVYSDQRPADVSTMEPYVMDERFVNESHYNALLGSPLEQRSPQSNQLISVNTSRNSAIPSTANSTQSNVLVKEFVDPNDPNAAIRLERSVVTQLFGNDPDTQAVTNTQIVVQRTDGQGNVTEKELAFNEGTADRDITIRTSSRPVTPNRPLFQGRIEEDYESLHRPRGLVQRIKNPLKKFKNKLSLN